MVAVFRSGTAAVSDFPGGIGMRSICIMSGVTALAMLLAPPALAQAGSASHEFRTPIDYYQLTNGLKVVLSRDPTVPTAVVAVFYHVGFRTEPRDRTGFAHLFEHLMFQGSPNLGRSQFMKLVEQTGGRLNGSARFDFTSYYESIPSHALRRLLWAEADRMRGLVIDSTTLRVEREVVKSEIRTIVLNRPYGGFPWIDLAVGANTNLHNAHNFYGEMAELDSVSLRDVQNFSRTYYAPNNAVLVVTGDIDVRAAREWIAEYFGAIPASAMPPKPDVSELRQLKEKRFTRVDSLAPRPAIGIAYRLPARFTPEWYAFGLLDQLLGQGRDGRFYRELVQKRALTSGVDAGYGLGYMFDYEGPALWELQIFHDSDKPRDSIVAAIDSAIEPLRTTLVDRETLDLALLKFRSAFYTRMEYFGGYGLANLLAALALFDNDPERINRIERDFGSVTPELLQRTVLEYLRPGNRTIEFIEPAAKRSSASP
jgi:predicted Zn-dependent peptidase